METEIAAAHEIRRTPIDVRSEVLVVLGGPPVWWFNKHPTANTASKTPSAPKLISVDAKQIDDIVLVKPSRFGSNRAGETGG